MQTPGDGVATLQFGSLRNFPKATPAEKTINSALADVVIAVIRILFISPHSMWKEAAEKQPLAKPLLLRLADFDIQEAGASFERSHH